ncbi:MAG: hypothetical protein II126_02045, partial [Erysipelotrichaceae bacterium]|nr:hypothetical protein [Erysipelotrichaceae bacterium]
TSSLRQEVYIRFFSALDEVVRKQLIDTIGISPSTGTVTVHFENIYPVWDFNAVTTGLLRGKQMLNPVFMLEQDGEVFPFDQALNNGSLLIIRSQTGGITQALTAQARQLIAAGQNVIYLDSFQNGKEPLFTAIERTYGITKLNTKDIVAFVFINFQQQISPDYGSILLNNILLDLQELLKSNSRLHIILGYRSDVSLNGIIREAFRDEHEAFHSLGYNHGRLMEYLSINGIQLPEDINIRELLFSNLDFLCEFCAKGNSIEQAMKTLSSEQISRLFRPKDSLKGNELQLFSVVTSILFQHDLLKEDFISDFSEEVRSSIRDEFGFELISFSDYRRTAIELNAINQDRWIAAAGCYYAALGAVYRLRGSQKEMILSKMEASLKHIIPDSTAVLTARLFIDQLGIDGQQKLDAILQPLDEECRILLVEIIGRLISYYEVIRNSKAFIAGKALMTVNCLRRYWEANPQRTELIILIVDTCYSMLQTRSALEKGDYIRICHEVRRQLEYVLESGVFDGDEPDMLAERSRTISNIGACCLALGEEAEGEEAREYFRSALQYHQKAAEIRFRLKKTESKFAYRYATSIANIGTTYYYLSDFEKSYEYQKTGYELRKKENYMVVQSCNRLAGVLLRTGDSFFRNKVDEMLPLLNDAAQIMLGKPEQYHEEILLLQENFIFFLERVKTDRELLCSHIFDLLSTASEIDELCFEEYARDHDRCRYLVLRKWLSPLEDLFMIFAASIRTTMRVISKSSPLQSSLIADSLELLDNRSSRSLSDAQYVNACAFILRSCFDYRGKKALVSRYIGKKPSSDGSYTLAKQYYKELFSAYHGDASFIPLSELKPESEFVRFLQDTSRQGIIDDDTALTNRENILKTVEAFRLLNPVDPEGAAMVKHLMICPLGASTNTNYYRTKAAYELYCQRLEAGRDSIIYAP